MTLTEHKTDTLHYFLDEDGNRQGDHKLWYTNGQLYMHSFYMNGKLHGEYKSWHENGQLRIHCFYVGGKRQGEYKWWYAGGQIRGHCIFINDKLTDIPIPSCEEDKFAICLEHGQMEFIKA